jgi:homoaconitase/3-isopropylmalate dehydratase large subunit
VAHIVGEDTLTAEELKMALAAVRLWFRKPDSEEVAYRGTVLHPQDAADDMMRIIRRFRQRGL